MSLAAMDYQSIFKFVPEPCLILDPEQRIIDASNAYLNSDYAIKKDIVGNDILKIYSHNIEPYDLDNLKKSIQHVKTSGKEHIIEIKIKNQKSIIPNQAYRYLKITHTPVYTENKKLKFIMHHIADITEFSLIKKIESQENKLTEKLITQNSEIEKELYQRMQELEALATIVEFTEDAIITISLDGIVETWNAGAEKLYGYSAEEVIGKSFKILFPNNKLDEYNNIMNQVNQSKPTHYSDTECKHKKGHHIPISVTISPLKNNQMQLIGACSIARDFSEFKRNQALVKKNKELEEISKLKNQFIANVSHELRTPLHGILGFSELLIHDKQHPLIERQKEYLRDIIKCCKHVTSVINAILDIAKIEAGKMELCPIEIDVAKFIADAKVLFQNALNKKDLTLEINHDKTIETIYHDPEKFKQIVYNYMSNAIKFTPPGGKISLTVKPEKDNFFRLTIKDSGIGISKENISKLFVEFQQLDISTTKKYQGTGLGLSIVKKIAEMLGGSVGVESEPNTGSAFYVILPYRTPDDLNT